MSIERIHAILSRSFKAMNQSLSSVSVQNQGEAKHTGSITRHAGIVSFFTFISRIFGFLRDQVVVHLFGASQATDSFFVAFTIPNVFRRLVAEGSLTISFIPLFKEILVGEGKDQAYQFFCRVFTLLCIVLAGLIGLGILFAPYIVHAVGYGCASEEGQSIITIHLTRMMFPYLFFVSLVALAMGVLNSLEKFAAPAAAPIFLNIAMIVCAWFLHTSFAVPIESLAVGVLVGGVIQVVLQIPALKKLQMLPQFTTHILDSRVKQLLKLMTPALIGLSVYQMNIIVNRQLACLLPPGNVTYYYNSDRMLELVTGIFVISIATATLPALSEKIASKKIQEAQQAFMFSIKMTLLITIPAITALILLAQPIMSTFYYHGAFTQHDVTKTAELLVYFAIAILPVSIVRIIVPAFYAIKDTKTPVKAAFVAFTVNAVMGYSFLDTLGIKSLALSMIFSTLAQGTVLFIALRRKIELFHFQSIRMYLLKLIIAALVMATFLSLLSFPYHWNRPTNIISVVYLLFLCVSGAGLYFFILIITGVQEAQLLREKIVHKLKRIISR